MFLYPALGFALFFGLRAVYIFVDPKIHEKKKDKDEEKNGKRWERWFYQFWYNFVGAFIGWVALYYIWEIDISKFRIEHFVALIIAFLGITGNLPYVARYWKTG